MNILDLIKQKRDGGELSTRQIDWFISAYTADRIPDYQVAAFLMAIYIRGMNRRETVDLTLATASSGEQLDLHDVVPFVVDKHSSGGVGDKTSLVVLPVVAACGVPVGKMSGRGLGQTGGTLDKMESITGWRADLTLEQFKSQLADIGLVLAGQTAKLAPADGKLYALRDVTGTIANTSLMTASIMSKKLAAGADAIVLDIKVGHGAFMSSVEGALELAEMMVDIGVEAGRETVALISDMNQPLGYAVGNSLEVKEAIETMHGRGPDDFVAHCLEVAGHLVLLGGKADTLADAKQKAKEQLTNGRALKKFRLMVESQGGDPGLIDNPDGLPKAAIVDRLYAERSGYIAGIEAGMVGWSCVPLGAGRETKNAPIDHAVGMTIPVKVGDYINAGEILGTVHANDQSKCRVSLAELEAAISWSDEPVPPLPHFYDTVTKERLS